MANKQYSTAEALLKAEGANLGTTGWLEVTQQRAVISVSLPQA